MPEILVFDTGPLSHFALADWLGVLKAVVGKRVAVIPDTVAVELRAGGARDSRIAAVADAPWIEVRELSSPHELDLFGTFSSLLVEDDRNVGEAAVLALAALADDLLATEYRLPFKRGRFEEWATEHDMF